MKKIVRASFIAILSIAVLAESASCLSRFIARKQFQPVFQKGMCYTTWNKTAYGTVGSDKSLEKLKELNVEWVAILTTWYQDNCFSTEIFPTGTTPSDKSIKQAIEKAHSLGMKVMLKPHLDLLSTEEGSWRGEIASMRESDWQVWFESYKNFMLHYAKIAEETNVEMLCVGTELTSATATNGGMWRGVINAVRRVYKGDLIYAANWNEEYLHIRFWDALDYAGIDVYFPLSDKVRPTYDELIEAWKRWILEIEEWQKTVNKPVVFTEAGYRSSTRPASSPWEGIPAGEKVDLELQVVCYKALVDTFWNKDWFYGAYWWNWGTNVRMGGKFNREFTPQNKPAQDYIAELYKREVKK